MAHEQEAPGLGRERGKAESKVRMGGGVAQPFKGLAEMLWSLFPSDSFCLIIADFPDSSEFSLVLVT